MKRKFHARKILENIQISEYLYGPSYERLRDQVMGVSIGSGSKPAGPTPRRRRRPGGWALGLLGLEFMQKTGLPLRVILDRLSFRECHYSTIRVSDKSLLSEVLKTSDEHFLAS